ncbi:MAG: PAS domain-containing protein [Alphaproteobacteria bacterium]|nr:MAG: PAS domain-containing protein [Alphaproteobacteria bacterium]
MRDGILGEVLRYWNGLRDGNALPRHADIRPADLSSALDCSFILERVGDGNIRFRVVGERVSALLGMDMRAMPLRAIFEPEHRRWAEDVIDRVFTAENPVELRLESRAGGLPPISGHMIVLPLADAAGATTRALGCIALHGPVLGVPRRFEVTEVIIDDEKLPDTPPLRQDDDVLGIAEAQAPFAGPDQVPVEGAAKAAGGHPARPRLRLVGGRDMKSEDEKP